MSIFDNEIIHLHNPLPSISVEELHARAKVILRMRRLAKEKVFNLELRWGGGQDLETKTLKPGTSMRLSEEKAREVIADFRPVGGGLCATNPGLAYFADEADKLSASIEALHIAEQHYHICGTEQLDHVRTTLGHRDDEVERLRSSKYASYFLNIAKQEAIREQREKLEQKLLEKDAQRDADKQRVANGRG